MRREEKILKSCWERDSRPPETQAFKARVGSAAELEGRLRVGFPVTGSWARPLCL